MEEENENFDNVVEYGLVTPTVYNIIANKNSIQHDQIPKQSMKILKKIAYYIPIYVVNLLVGGYLIVNAADLVESSFIRQLLIATYGLLLAFVLLLYYLFRFFFFIYYYCCFLVVVILLFTAFFFLFNFSCF
jgi:cell division protein FtsW (lipid II flippase)